MLAFSQVYRHLLCLLMNSFCSILCGISGYCCYSSFANFPSLLYQCAFQYFVDRSLPLKVLAFIPLVPPTNITSDGLIFTRCPWTWVLPFPFIQGIIDNYLRGFPQIPRGSCDQAVGRVSPIPPWWECTGQGQKNQGFGESSMFVGFTKNLLSAVPSY